MNLSIHRSGIFENGRPVDNPIGEESARVASDGRLVALEQRLTDENVARISAQTTRRDDVRDLLGPPYTVSSFPRMERETWSWYMKRFGVLPVTLNVQMSADGVVREIYVLDDYNKGSRKR